MNVKKERLIQSCNHDFAESLQRKAADQVAELLLRQLKLFTMTDSSSLPIEKVEEIYHSILYTLMTAELKDTRSTQETVDIFNLFRKGRQEIEKKIRRGKKLLFRARYTKLDIPNVAYLDTYRAISQFFPAYDLRFSAHEVPCMIDYQLAGGQPGSEGIDYINAYLERLDIENRFCRRFARERVVTLLKAYVPDYVDLIYNIFEPVAHNAIGLALLGENPQRLRIEAWEAKELAQKFQGTKQEEYAFLIENAVTELIGFFQISEADERKYLFKTGSEMIPRLRNEVDFTGVFIG